MISNLKSREETQTIPFQQKIEPFRHKPVKAVVSPYEAGILSKNQIPF